MVFANMHPITTQPISRISATPREKARRGIFDWQAGNMPGKRRRKSLARSGKTRHGATKNASGITCWPNRDPIGEKGGINIYVYIYNQSILYFDYLGLFGKSDVDNIINSDLNKIKTSTLAMGTGFPTMIMTLQLAANSVTNWEGTLTDPTASAQWISISFSNNTTIRVNPNSTNYSEVMHEVAHDFIYRNLSLSHKDDEGTAHFVESALQGGMAVAKLGDILGSTTAINCESLTTSINQQWQDIWFWLNYQAKQAQYTTWLGTKSSFYLDSSHANNVKTHFGLNISCASLRNKIQSKLDQKFGNCCIKISCDPTEIGSIRPLPGDVPRPEFQ